MVHSDVTWCHVRKTGAELGPKILTGFSYPVDIFHTMDLHEAIIVRISRRERERENTDEKKERTPRKDKKENLVGIFFFIFGATCQSNSRCLNVLSYLRRQ